MKWRNWDSKCWRNCKILNCKGSQIKLRETATWGKQQKQGENRAWSIWEEGWAEKLQSQVGGWAKCGNLQEEMALGTLIKVVILSQKKRTSSSETGVTAGSTFTCGTRIGSGSIRDESLQRAMWRVIFILTLVELKHW